MNDLPPAPPSDCARALATENRSELAPVVAANKSALLSGAERRSALPLARAGLLRSTTGPRLVAIQWLKATLRPAPRSTIDTDCSSASAAAAWATSSGQKTCRRGASSPSSSCIASCGRAPTSPRACSRKRSSCRRCTTRTSSRSSAPTSAITGRSSRWSTCPVAPRACCSRRSAGSTRRQRSPYHPGAVGARGGAQRGRGAPRHQPENVLVVASAAVAVSAARCTARFGIAKLEVRSPDAPRRAPASCSARRSVASSHGEGDLDSRSDLFSLGIVMFELLTGRRPFSASTAVATAFRIVHASPPSSSRWPSRVDRDSRQRAQAAREDPSERPASASEVLRVLLSPRPRREARARVSCLASARPTTASDPPRARRLPPCAPAPRPAGARPRPGGCAPRRQRSHAYTWALCARSLPAQLGRCSRARVRRARAWRLSRCSRQPRRRAAPRPAERTRHPRHRRVRRYIDMRHAAQHRTPPASWSSGRQRSTAISSPSWRRWCARPSSATSCVARSPF